jgi:hypothetical protein
MANMIEVIDALERCKPYCMCDDDGCPYYQTVGCIEVVRKDALELLKEQPEQKHGHWIEQDDYNDTYYECSVCGEPWVLIDGTPSENNMCFCPKCGAKMDGEVKQE